MSNKELRKKLETCREDVAELKEEITECKLAKVRRQNKDLQRRLNALEQRDPRATAKLRRRRAKNNDAPSRRAVRAARAVRPRRIPQRVLEMKDDDPPEVPQRRRLRRSRFRAPPGAPPEQQDQQWRSEQPARIDQNQSRSRERQRIMQRNNQSWEEEPDNTEQDREDEERTRRMEQLNRDRQFAARERERLAAKRAAKRKEKQRIEKLPPVKRNGEWWKEMYEGELYDTTWGEMSTDFTTGRRFRRLTPEEADAWDDMRRRIDARRTTNNSTTLRF